MEQDQIEENKGVKTAEEEKEAEKWIGRKKKTMGSITGGIWANWWHSDKKLVGKWWTSSGENDGKSMKKKKKNEKKKTKKENNE